eukprot:1144406-Pelagomonas_calceolata.AAC.2
MARVAALKAHTIRKPPCTPPDLWAGTPLVQQEAFLTFLINNQAPWVAALKAPLADDMDCGTASAEGWDLFLELYAGSHSGSLHAGLATQELQLGIRQYPWGATTRLQSNFSDNVLSLGGCLT